MDDRRECQGCGELTYRPAVIPGNAVFCMGCDPDGSKRAAAIGAVEVIEL